MCVAIKGAPTRRSEKFSLNKLYQKLNIETRIIISLAPLSLTFLLLLAIRRSDTKRLCWDEAEKLVKAGERRVSLLLLLAKKKPPRDTLISRKVFLNLL